MTQKVEVRPNLVQNSGAIEEIENPSVTRQQDSAITKILGNWLIVCAIHERLTRCIPKGVVESVDAYNVETPNGGQMWLSARINSSEGYVSRTLFIDEDSRGDFTSPELSEKCDTVLGAIAMGHDACGESYYDSAFFHGQ